MRLVEENKSPKERGGRRLGCGSCGRNTSLDGAERTKNHPQNISVEGLWTRPSQWRGGVGQKPDLGWWSVKER